MNIEILDRFFDPTFEICPKLYLMATDTRFQLGATVTFVYTGEIVIAADLPLVPTTINGLEYDIRLTFEPAKEPFNAGKYHARYSWAHTDEQGWGIHITDSGKAKMREFFEELQHLVETDKSVQMLFEQAKVCEPFSRLRMLDNDIEQLRTELAEKTDARIVVFNESEKASMAFHDTWKDLIP